MKLYDFEKSGNCYKIRLFLSLLGLRYTRVPVDLSAGENWRGNFLALNPNGLVPVLSDGAVTIYDSAAILAYLARTYAPDDWLPSDPVQFSRVVRWLAFEQSEGRYGLARARAIALGNPTALARSGSLEESRAIAKAALETLDRQLSETRWLAGGETPTIGDIACYPYTALCADAGLSLRPFPSIKRWLQRIENLPGYVTLTA